MPEYYFGVAIGHAQNCDRMLVAGCSGAAYPSASLPQLAKNRGALVIELNPSETTLTGCADLVWRETAVWRCRPSTAIPRANGCLKNNGSGVIAAPRSVRLGPQLLPAPAGVDASIRRLRCAAAAPRR
ncbi:SIR2 family NAD-dependent protein deacylase [Mycolicibacter arupensis]|uniref:hypothetical protein n=1 Tax=Mycolicibacter arupensis TaxID=342002 RepID=UPI0021F3A508|nr:hypothetical protein [Mycolicibacter arupensis]